MLISNQLHIVMMHCMMPLFIREIVEIELIVAFQASLRRHFTVDHPHNAPALSHTTRTDKADNWPFYMASWDRAQLWCIPMPYKWANVSSFTMQYWWLMERLSPSNISGLTHWYARSEWTAAKGPYAAGIEAK